MATKTMRERERDRETERQRERKREREIRDTFCLVTFYYDVVVCQLLWFSCQVIDAFM